MITIDYHGIRADDPNGRNGLRNPERGWRTETVIAEPVGSRRDMGVHGRARHLDGRLTPGYHDQWWLLDAGRYEPYGLTLVQMYCYLDAFCDGALTDAKLQGLQTSLDRLRARGLKTLLRFAYERSTRETRGPTADRILAHLEQLAPVIRDNADVIYVLQAGFIGAYGEWHASVHGIEKDHGALAAIMTRLLAILPPDRMTQVRVPKYKRWALGVEALDEVARVTAPTAHGNEPAARIGFHNDGFLANESCGGTWKEPPHFSNPGNPEFDYLTAESPYVPVDGELFWRDQLGPVDGLAAIRRMRLHHYNTFSLWHSYSGREGSRYTIDQWMRNPLALDQVRDEKLPLSAGYFSDGAGERVARTQFEYLTDHLGYRFELQRASYPERLRTGEPFTLRLELINRGFAVPHNPRPVYLVLITADDRVTALPCPGVDPRAWQPFPPEGGMYGPFRHYLDLSFALPQFLQPGWIQFGLWLPDAAERLRLDPRYAVRVANRDVPWWTDDAGHYGVNLLGVFELGSG